MRIIVDCTPGDEDALALAHVVAAHHSGRAELECVTAPVHQPQQPVGLGNARVPARYAGSVSDLYGASHESR